MLCLFVMFVIVILGDVDNFHLPAKSNRFKVNENFFFPSRKGTL